MTRGPDPPGNDTLRLRRRGAARRPVTDPLSNVTSYGVRRRRQPHLGHRRQRPPHDVRIRPCQAQDRSARWPSASSRRSYTTSPATRPSTPTSAARPRAMTYDRRDRMLTKVPDVSLDEASHSYTYSPTNMRLSSTDGTGTTDYTYDARDRLATKAAAAGTLTYTYDATGNVATIRSSNANGSPRRQRHRPSAYAWNEVNELVSVTDNRVGGTTTRGLHAHETPGELDPTATVSRLAYSYDALDRVTSMLWRQGTAAPAFGSWSYAFNLRGQRLSSMDITGRAATYTYDSAARLATETITRRPARGEFQRFALVCPRRRRRPAVAAHRRSPRSVRRASRTTQTIDSQSTATTPTATPSAPMVTPSPTTSRTASSRKT